MVFPPKREVYEVLKNEVKSLWEENTRLRNEKEESGRSPVQRLSYNLKGEIVKRAEERKLLGWYLKSKTRNENI